MDIDTNTPSLTYASLRHELDALGDLVRRMREFVQNYAAHDKLFSTASSHSSSSSLSWLLKLVRDAADVNPFNAYITHNYHHHSAPRRIGNNTKNKDVNDMITPPLSSPTAVEGMDCGDMLCVLFARVDRLLLMIRQSTRLSKSAGSRVCEAQTLEFRANLQRQARKLLEEVHDLVLGEGTSPLSAGLQLKLLMFIEKNYRPRDAGGFPKASPYAKPQTRPTRAEMDSHRDGSSTSFASTSSSEEEEEKEDAFRNVFRWQTALRQRQRHFLLAEAHDYAAAAHLWRRMAVELADFAISSSAREALTRGMLAASAACGAWMADSIAFAGEESPLPGWFCRALESRGPPFLPVERQARARAGGGGLEAPGLTSPCAFSSVDFIAAAGEKNGEGFAFVEGGGGAGPTFSNRTMPRQLAMVYAALMSTAATLEQDFVSLEEATNFYELAGLVLIEKDTRSRALVECHRAGDLFSRSTGGGKAESGSRSSQIFSTTGEEEGDSSIGEVGKRNALRVFKDPSGFTDSLSQELQQRRQSALAGLFTRYGIDQQLRHNNNGSFSSSSSGGVGTFLKGYVRQNHLERTSRISAMTEGESKRNLQKDSASSAMSAVAAQQNLMTCLRQCRDLSFYDSVNVGGYLCLFLRSMRRASLVSASLGDYPRVLLYIEAALNALFTEEQRIQKLQTIPASNFSGEVGTPSLDLERLLLFRPPSTSSCEMGSRGEIAFCFAFVTVKVFFLVLRFLVLLVVDESRLTGEEKPPRGVKEDAKPGSGDKAANLAEASKKRHITEESTHPNCGKGPASTSAAALSSLQALKALATRARRVEAACVVVNFSPASLETLVSKLTMRKERKSEGEDTTAETPLNFRKAPHYCYFPIPALLGNISEAQTVGGESYADAAADFPSSEEEETIARASERDPSGVVRGAAYKLLKAHVLTAAAQPQRMGGAGPTAILSNAWTREASSLSSSDDFSGRGGLPSLFRCSQDGPSGERTRLTNWVERNGGSVSGRKAAARVVAKLDDVVEDVRLEKRTYCDLLNELSGVLSALYTQATQGCSLAGSFVEQVAPQGGGREGMKKDYRVSHAEDVWEIDHPFTERCSGVDGYKSCPTNSTEGSACKLSRAPNRVTNNFEENPPGGSVLTSYTLKDPLQHARESRDTLTRQMDKLENLLVSLGLRNRVFLMLIRRLQRKWNYPDFALTAFTFSSTHRTEEKL